MKQFAWNTQLGSESENVNSSVVSDSATPWTVACQTPLSIECSRQEYWRGLPFPSLGDLSYPGIKPRSFFTVWTTREAHRRVVIKSQSHVWFFVTPWTTACQAPLSFTISWNLLKLMSTEMVMLSNHLILCRPLLLLPSIFPSIRIFSNELALRIRWPKYWSFSFSISPSNEYSGLISLRIDWFDLLAVQGTFNSLLQQHNSKTSILWCSGKKD